MCADRGGHAGPLPQVCLPLAARQAEVPLWLEDANANSGLEGFRSLTCRSMDDVGGAGRTSLVHGLLITPPPPPAFLEVIQRNFPYVQI